MVTSAQARRLTGRSRDTPLIELVVVSHADLTPSLYFANNTPGNNITSTVSGSSQTYTAYPFGMARPSKGEEMPRARVMLENVDRAIGEIVSDLRGPLTIDLYTVFEDDVNTIVESYLALKLRNVTFNALGVEGDLADDDLTTEPCPALRATPDLFPALFR